VDIKIVEPKPVFHKNANPHPVSNKKRSPQIKTVAADIATSVTS
jgi:hypothetical protein